MHTDSSKQQHTPKNITVEGGVIDGDYNGKIISLLKITHPTYLKVKRDKRFHN